MGTRSADSPPMPMARRTSSPSPSISTFGGDNWSSFRRLQRRRVCLIDRSPLGFFYLTGRRRLAREQRRLAAILFADAVGSSRLMGRDESGTVARLLEHLNQR